ncbi:MAG TPA: SRPBCC family protein [Thermoleophilaceae bacterium]|nr:SRPBCC family protein [Thermoleophilaceae bacterium]
MRGLSSNGGGPVKKVGEKVGGSVKEAVGDTVEKAGGAGGLAKEAGKGILPGGGGGGKSKGAEGVGKGRRMPVQQDIDIGAPLKTVYNEWTQFEKWPEFMHRLENVSQEDESHVSFKVKIWGKSKEFKAEIVEQRPDERIKWKVVEGVTHTGVVTFHELGPRLTRVELNIDVQPGSLIEKAARGMRHVKRAVRADLARFKAHVLMEDEESGAWRGKIEDGEVKSKSSASSSGSSRSRSSGRSSSGRKSSGRKSSGRSSSGSRSSGSGSSGSRASGSRASGSRSKAASSGRSGASTSGRSRSSSSRSRSSSNGGSGGSRASGRKKSSSGSRS